jgi:uncharacterized protein (TIGR02452 family)
MGLAGTAASTLAIVDAGSYVAPSGRRIDLAAAIAEAVGGTLLYRPAELQALVEASARPGGGTPRIEVTGETTSAAARRLASEGRVAALNFASAKNPGGGFLGGARAQEEDLARASALYTCQLTQRDYYDANRACESMLYTDHIIYSPGVPFFRDDRLELLEEPYRCSIVTAPAPNAGEALRRDPGARPAIARVLQRRAAMVLAVAAEQQERSLVLGAWGCGVFRNEPAEVAAVFADLLASPRFAGAFDRVVFAIHDRSPKRLTLAAFEQRFGAASGR